MFFRPKGVASPALIVFVHGGAWISGDKREYVRLGQRYAAQGIAFAAVNYRLSTDLSVRHPMHAEDTAAAITHLVRGKGEFDRSRVVLVGHSAGAHILATLATRPDLWRIPWRPAGYVGLEGIYDIPDLAQCWPTYPDWFLRKAFGDEANWAAASPTRLRNGDHRPWLVLHSRGDELVDLQQSVNFARAVRRQGVRANLVTVPTKRHFEVVHGLGVPGDPASDAIVAFIAGLRGGSGRRRAR